MLPIPLIYVCTSSNFFVVLCTPPAFHQVDFMELGVNSLRLLLLDAVPAENRGPALLAALQSLLIAMFHVDVGEKTHFLHAFCRWLLDFSYWRSAGMRCDDCVSVLICASHLTPADPP